VSLDAVQSWIALIVAVVSIGIAFYGVKLQRQNNLMAVRPLPYISCADYEDLLWVKVRNDGVGPLLVRNVTIRRDGAPGQFDNIVNYLPALPSGLFWSKLTKDYVRTVPVGSDMPLLELRLDAGDRAQVKFREACRSELKRLELTVEYTDLHGSFFEPVSRNLDWFGQRLASSRATQS
jgi:hypothetical protein